MDISLIPFSMAGSYLAVSERKEKSEDEAGCYIRSVHGTGYMPGITMMRSVTFCARILPLFEDRVLRAEIMGDYDEVSIRTEKGEIRITFGDERTLLLRGEGLKLCLELADGNFIQSFRYRGADYSLLNCRSSDRRLAVSCQKGALQARKKQHGGEASHDCLICSPQDGEWLVAVEDMGEGWLPQKRIYDYEACKIGMKKSFETFATAMPEVPGRYADAKMQAAYVSWSCLVEKEGFLTRKAMLMSKNVMCNVWSWDHCFNAVAASYKNPELAWEQFMLLFDYQDAMGALPDSVSDAYVPRAFCKPPIHGWALSKMMKHMELTAGQCRMAYEKLEKWTLWWLEYRDSDSDGICEYCHGHDSGWDNSTAFMEGDNVALPDLAAFLILQMETLAELAVRLSKEKEAAFWQKRAEKMLADMVELCFDAERPIAFRGKERREVQTESLILYMPILLGKRLPKRLQKYLVSVLKSAKFRTDHGFASEALDSPYYEKDGYWRGPIWAPPTLFLVEGLYETGESEFARQIAEAFCDMAAKNGCAENFDAKSGRGLRDKAYTWTASVFFILAQEYLYGGVTENE